MFQGAYQAGIVHSCACMPWIIWVRLFYEECLCFNGAYQAGIVHSCACMPWII